MTLRIAIVGAGLIGPRHAQSVMSNPYTELVAIVDPVPNGAVAASELGTDYFPSITAMLAAITRPNAAIVCTPNHTHVPVAKEVLSNGMHVLVEKPISESIESGLELLQYCNSSDSRCQELKLLVGHHRRFNPYVVKTKQILESGSLGPVIAVNGLWTAFKPDSYFAPPGDWRRSCSAGGGVLPINFVHDIDIMHHLFGRVVSVYAEKTRPQRFNPPHDAEEGAALTLRFASGVVGTFLVCDASPSPHNFETGTGENPHIPKSPAADFYRIFGANASLSVPDMTRCRYDGRDEKGWNQQLKTERVLGMEEDAEMGKMAPFDLQLAHFVDVIYGSAEANCSGSDGLRALMVCDALKRAMETGQPVEINRIPS